MRRLAISIPDTVYVLVQITLCTLYLTPTSASEACCTISQSGNLRLGVMAEVHQKHPCSNMVGQIMHTAMQNLHLAMLRRMSDTHEGPHCCVLNTSY